MNAFTFRQGQLLAEDVPVAHIAATVGTPCYIYARSAIVDRWQAFDQAFGRHPHLVCYAVKANGNLAILNALAQLGAGFDVVSIGELERVVAAGGDPTRIVFSGVGKRREELERALSLNIYCFNIESEAEAALLEQVAADRGQCAPVALRINPDVDAKTHPYISTGLKQNKFGIDPARALALYRMMAASPHLHVTGIDCHIGSQLTDLAPFTDALERVLALVAQLEAEGMTIQHLDLGGGLGVCYREEAPPSPEDYVATLLQALQEKSYTIRNKSYTIVIEPGRAIVGEAGILVTQVERIKAGDERQFAIVDAAMNDLMRPALYSAWHEIIPVLPRTVGEAVPYDVVGPVCETGDFLGKDRLLNVIPGDLLAVCTAGAYGFAMSSNYNARPRVAEVMVSGDQFQVVRWRERIADLFAGESLWAL